MTAAEGRRRPGPRHRVGARRRRHRHRGARPPHRPPERDQHRHGRDDGQGIGRRGRPRSSAPASSRSAAAVAGQPAQQGLAASCCACPAIDIAEIGAGRRQHRPRRRRAASSTSGRGARARSRGRPATARAARRRRSPTPTSCLGYLARRAAAERPARSTASWRARPSPSRSPRRSALDAPRRPRTASYLLGCARMARAVRAVTVERGRDPREFAIVAFGGNGPLFAAEMARSPRDRDGARAAGAGRVQRGRPARGRARAPPGPDVPAPARRDDASDDVGAAFGALEAEAPGARWRGRAATGLVELDAARRPAYAGQSFELTIPLPGDGSTTRRPPSTRWSPGLRRGARAHRTATRRWTIPIQIVNLRLTARRARPGGPRGAWRLAAARRGGRPPDRGAPSSAARTGCSRPRHRPRGPRRDAAPGPLLIDEYDATTLVPPGAAARLDDHGNIVIATTEAAHDARRRSRRRPDPPRADQERARRDRRRDGDRAVRTAYSTNIKNAMDMSCALCDAEGRLIAQGLTLPLHLGSIPDAMARGPARSSPASIEPGRRVPAERPVRGRHAPARLLRRSSRSSSGERLVGWSVSIGHQTDVGGKTAGRQRLRTRPRSSRRACASRRSSSTSAGEPVRLAVRAARPRTCACRTRCWATCARRSPPASPASAATSRWSSATAPSDLAAATHRPPRPGRAAGAQRDHGHARRPLHVHRPHRRRRPRPRPDPDRGHDHGRAATAWSRDFDGLGAARSGARSTRRSRSPSPRSTPASAT